MPTMVREAWTDERLDDLQKHMDEGFREVRADLRLQREEMSRMGQRMAQQKHMDVRFEAQQKHMDVRFEAQQKHMDARFDDQRNHMDASFAALMRTIQIGFSVIGVLVAALMILIGIWL